MANNYYTIRSDNGVQIESPLFKIIDNGSTPFQADSSSINMSVSTTISGSTIISGSTTITGSVNITGSLLVNGSSPGGGDTTAVEAQFWFLL